MGEEDGALRRGVEGALPRDAGGFERKGARCDIVFGVGAGGSN